MRGIGERIRRYRLSRYGRSGGPTLRWAWPLLFLWLLYATLLGEHSLLRIVRMGAEGDRMDAELVATRAELDRLEQRLRDPKERKRDAERVLRERSGWTRPGEIVYRMPGGEPDTSISGGR